MGIAVANFDSAIVKATSGIMALTKKEIDIPEERSCIKCGRCINACPMAASQYAQHLKRKKTSDGSY